MGNRLYQLIDSIILNPITPLKLKLLQKLFNRGIPFNLPHNFKFLLVTKYKTVLELPLIYKNKNHLGGIHACAIATLGEYPAGLLIIKNIGATKYRIILENLNVDYKKQGREDLLGIVEVNRDDVIAFKERLESEGKGSVTLQTKILSKSDRSEVAIVTTKWQLKDWKTVKFKG